MIDAQAIGPYIDLGIKVVTALTPVVLVAAPVVVKIISSIGKTAAESDVKRAGMVAANAAVQSILSERAKSGKKGMLTPDELLPALEVAAKAANSVLDGAARKKALSAYQSDQNIDTSVACIRDVNMAKALAPHGLAIPNASVPTEAKEATK